MIGVGIEQFTTSTYDDVRMDEVARAASVSRALLYRYFPDKRTLFIAVVDEVSDRMLEKTAAGIDPMATPFQQARAAVLGYLEAYEQYPTVARAIFSDTVASDPRMVERDHAERQQLSSIVVRQIESINGRRLDPPDDRRLSMVATAWMGFIEQAIHDWVHDPVLDRAVIADTCADVLLDAVVRIPGISDSAKRTMIARDVEPR